MVTVKSFNADVSPNVRNVCFKTLNGGQFTLSTQLIISNYLVNLSIVLHRNKTGKKATVESCISEYVTHK